MDEPITRRGSLAKLGGFVVAAAGGSALLGTSGAEGGNKAVETGAVQCVLAPELTEGPYYIAGEKVRRDIREGHPGTLLTLRLTSSTRDVQADQGRGRRHLACGRRRELLRVRLRHVEQDVLARNPEDRQERPRCIHDDLSRLVPRTRGAHPREGARRRERRPYRPAVLPGRPDARGLQGGAYAARGNPSTTDAQTRSTSTAASADCWR